MVFVHNRLVLATAVDDAAAATVAVVAHTNRFFCSVMLQLYIIESLE